MTYRFRVFSSLLIALAAVCVAANAIPAGRLSQVFSALSGGGVASAASANKTSRPSYQVGPAGYALSSDDPGDEAKSPNKRFTLYQDANGDLVCRAATPAEIREMENPDLSSLGMRPINHLGG